jgi:small-conductance mechanosensitive channel
MKILDQLGWESLSAEYMATAVLLMGALVARHLATLSVHKAAMAPDQKRRWLVLARNVALLTILLGLLIIWGEELRSFAISVVAVLAALVLATKELLTCLTGSSLKAGSNSFRIGDRIEVSGLRGEVIDHNLLTTTLLEIGPGQSIHQRTGRRVVFPNSLLLTNAVINESFTHGYILHVFTVVIDPKHDWRQAEAILLEAANLACQEYIDDAHAHMEEMGKREGLDTSSASPKITIQFSKIDELTLVVRMAAPVGRRGQIEQEVLRAFADHHFQNEDKPVCPNDQIAVT